MPFTPSSPSGWREIVEAVGELREEVRRGEHRQRWILRVAVASPIVGIIGVAVAVSGLR
jgi:hypothetical protein